MLVNLKTVLEIAEKNQNAVGAFNVTSLENLQAVIEAAEELNVPVIIMHAEIHNVYNDISLIGPIMVRAAEKASVPVCVHLDHGTSFEMVYKSIQAGFTSIMYDASTEPYKINIENTQKIVEITKPLKISVEAELGKLPSREDGTVDESLSKASPEDFYTVPAEAKDFVDKTGIDALAIAFGTAHGFYNSEPVLCFDVVKNVSLATNGLPLVMHGGSGVGDAAFKEAIAKGIRKVNYYSYMSNVGYRAAEEVIRLNTTKYFHDLSYAARLAMKDDAKRALKIFSMK